MVTVAPGSGTPSLRTVPVSIPVVPWAKSVQLLTRSATAVMRKIRLFEIIRFLHFAPA
jgi:hypothetical protein